MPAQWIARWQTRFERIYADAIAHPQIGRVQRSYERYYGLGMHHVAGSITYSGVLTLFPFLGLLYAVGASFALSSSGLRDEINTALASGLGVNVDIGAHLFTKQAKATLHAVTATLGVLGLLYAGGFLVSAYRRALQLISVPGQEQHTSTLWSYVRSYIRDTLILLAFVTATLILIALAAAATEGPFKVLAAHGHAMSGWAVAVLRLIASALSVLWSALMCAALYHRLGGAPRSPAVRRASLLAGVCTAGLAIAGLLLLRRMFADPVYGIVIAILGLMLWVSAMVRITLAFGVWSATDEPAD